MSSSVYIINTPPGWLKTPPLALAYLKTYLDSKKIDAKVMDLNMALFQLYNFPKGQWLSLNDLFEKDLFKNSEQLFPEFFNNIYKRIENTDVVGFSLFKRNAQFTFSLAKRIREKFPDKRIAFGGPHTLFLDKRGVLDKEYTWVIGEGEIPFEKIASGDSKRIFRFEEVTDLDTLPFIDFQGLNLKSYQPVLPIFSSRGCRFKCAFCSERVLYHKFRQHSPKYMIEQIKMLKLKYSTDTFVFCDSMINNDAQWLEEFCRLLIAQELNIKWEAQFRIVAGFEPTLAAMMKASGCFNLFIGLESGSNHTLSLMKKGFSTDTAAEMFDCLKNSSLHFELSFIFGYPKETEKDFQETMLFILKNKHLIPKVAQANPFVDYLGNFPTSIPTEEATSRRAFIDFLNKKR